MTKLKSLLLLISTITLIPIQVLLSEEITQDFSGIESLEVNPQSVKLDNPFDYSQVVTMAKLKSGRLVREVADTCIQYYGGMGFTWENQASKLYRDGRLHSIGGGTDEIMLRIISKYLKMVG